MDNIIRTQFGLYSC